MASTHIEIVATASRLGSDARQFISQLQAVQDAVDKLKAIADQVAFEGDYAALGTKFGLNAADAETVYNILGSVRAELHATFIEQTLSRLG